MAILVASNKKAQQRGSSITDIRYEAKLKGEVKESIVTAEDFPLFLAAPNPLFDKVNNLLVQSGNSKVPEDVFSPLLKAFLEGLIKEHVNTGDRPSAQHLKVATEIAYYVPEIGSGAESVSLTTGLIDFIAVLDRLSANFVHKAQAHFDKRGIFMFVCQCKNPGDDFKKKEERQFISQLLGSAHANSDYLAGVQKGVPGIMTTGKLWMFGMGYPSRSTYCSS